MKLGISLTLPHSSPEEWAYKHKKFGCDCVVFPGKAKTDKEIFAYKKAADDYGLIIAEVGAWRNVLCNDEKIKKENIEFCKRKLEIAEEVKALCCVNISGTNGGDIWDGAYKENFLDDTYKKIVETTQEIIDAVNPEYTKYSLEPMPYMIPYSPENYLEISKDINRTGFGVHLDIVNMINSPKKYFFNEEFTNKCFELLKNSILSCHLKDVRLEQELTFKLSEVPCGKGGLNIKNYIENGNKINPDMPYIIEHLKEEEEYRKSVEYIKKESRQ